MTLQTQLQQFFEHVRVALEQKPNLRILISTFRFLEAAGVTHKNFVNIKYALPEILCVTPR
jgi:hypothetical protein